MYVLKIVCLLMLMNWLSYNQCCLTLKGKQCISCINGTHLYRGNCIIDVDNCATYKDGFDCITCNTGYQLTQNNQCIQIPPQQSSTTTTKQYTDTILDLKSPTTLLNNYYTLSLDYMNSIHTQLKASQPIAAMIRTYKNNTIIVTIQYKNLNNSYYQVIVQPDLNNLIFKELGFTVISAPTLPVTNAQVQQNITISTISTTSTNNNGGTTSTSTTTTTTTTSTDIFSSITTSSTNTTINPNSLTNLPYKVFDINSNDQTYLIILDFLYSQLPKYKSLKPIIVLKAITSTLIYYKLTYNLSDNSSWQITISFSADLFLVNILSDLQIQAPTKSTTTGTGTSNKVYVMVDIKIIYQDFMFILAMQSINKQSNNKYKDDVIYSVQKADDSQSVQYRIVFQHAGFYWEVQIVVLKAGFAISGFQEVKKLAIPTSNTNINTNTNSNTNSNSNTNINTNTNNTPANNLTPSNIASVTIETQSTTNNSSIKPNSSKGSQNVQPNNTNQNSNSNTNANSNSNSNSNSNPNTNTNIPIPQKILQSSIGLTQLTPEQIASPDFKQINDLVKMTNTNQLTGSSLVAAYVSSASFTRSYKIYYRKNLDYYQCKLTRDQLRKRTYIISFTKII